MLAANSARLLLHSRFTASRSKLRSRSGKFFHTRSRLRFRSTSFCPAPLRFPLRSHALQSKAKCTSGKRSSTHSAAGKTLEDAMCFSLPGKTKKYTDVSNLWVARVIRIDISTSPPLLFTGCQRVRNFPRFSIPLAFRAL